MSTTPKFQLQLRALVDTHGVSGAARLLGTNRETLARMIAGIEVKPVSLRAVTAALASLPAPVALASAPQFGEAPSR